MDKNQAYSKTPIPAYCQHTMANVIDEDCISDIDQLFSKDMLATFKPDQKRVPIGNQTNVFDKGGILQGLKFYQLGAAKNVTRLQTDPDVGVYLKYKQQKAKLLELKNQSKTPITNQFQMKRVQSSQLLLRKPKKTQEQISPFLISQNQQSNTNLVNNLLKNPNGQESTKSLFKNTKFIHSPMLGGSPSHKEISTPKLNLLINNNTNFSSQLQIPKIHSNKNMYASLLRNNRDTAQQPKVISSPHISSEQTSELLTSDEYRSSHRQTTYNNSPQKQVEFLLPPQKNQQVQALKQPQQQQQKKKKIVSYERIPTKISTSKILGLKQHLFKRATIAHFEQINDPTDPLYLMKSNYYRNNFVQELDEVKNYKGNPGRVILGNLIKEIPQNKFHGYLNNRLSQKHIANVRDPTKFKHQTLHSTKNYYQYATNKVYNVQDPLPEAYNTYSYNSNYFKVKELDKVAHEESNRTMESKGSQRKLGQGQIGMNIMDQYVMDNENNGDDKVIKRLVDDNSLNCTSRPSTTQNINGRGQKQSRASQSANGKRGGVWINFQFNS